MPLPMYSPRMVLAFTPSTKALITASPSRSHGSEKRLLSKSSKSCRAASGVIDLSWNHVEVSLSFDVATKMSLKLKLLLVYGFD